MKERLIKKFEDEIAALDRELKLELPREIKRARELGDLRENAEYSAAKERQRLVESRISLLKKRVSEIALINVDRIPSDRAGFGSTVHVLESTGETLVFQLVMPEDADGKGLISTTSPIGRAILNKEVGDSVKVTTPGGSRQFEITKLYTIHDEAPGMNERFAGAPPTAEFYSPTRRTALVLTGTGTAGAYHAGVLRALQEAGVEIDIVSGRGIGVVGALFAAIDSGQRLWDDKGFWTAPAVRSLYRWKGAPRIVGWGIAAAVTVVAIPLVALALGLVVFPIDFVARMVGLGGASGLTGAYLRLAQTAFAPQSLPTWLPRLAVLLLGSSAIIAVLAGVAATRGRRLQGPVWWRVASPPLSADEGDRALLAHHVGRGRWRRAAATASARNLGRRYTDLLAENLGQPGFRELLIAVHDLDAHRDVVFALVGESRRRDLVRRATSEATERRRAEMFDLAGVAGDQLAAVVAGALTIPIATDTRTVTFAPDGYWRGETHRLCDRPGSLARILDELVDLDVAQIILVSAAPESTGPHTLAPPRIDGRGRIGEYLISAEAAIVRDVTCAADAPAPRIFTIQPVHNPLGPFDFRGVYDDRSERPQPLGELIAAGYEDAYRQFIEPVIGASGERVGRGEAAL